VRAFPNRYPIFTGGPGGGGPRHGELAAGHSEVVVHSPDHNAQLGTAEVAAVRRTVNAWRLRHLALRSEGWTSVVTAVNHKAGASQAHPHSQIVALPFVPDLLETEAESMDDACLLCRLGQAVDEDLVVDTTPELMAICPVWSQVPYEMLLFPRRHEVRLEEGENILIEQLADLLHSALGRLHRAVGDPPFTLALHTAPRGDPGRFHWHLHVWPRTSTEGGIEWGTGIGVVTVEPQAAARELRAGAASPTG
jgi:UDPglucose--hexose-1-phosphate uridylyltransferase